MTVFNNPPRLMAASESCPRPILLHQACWALARSASSCRRVLPRALLPSGVVGISDGKWRCQRRSRAALPCPVALCAAAARGALPLAAHLLLAPLSRQLAGVRPLAYQAKPNAHGGGEASATAADQPGSTSLEGSYLFPRLQWGWEALGFRDRAGPWYCRAAGHKGKCCVWREARESWASSKLCVRVGLPTPQAAVALMPMASTLQHSIA